MAEAKNRSLEFALGQPRANMCFSSRLDAQWCGFFYGCFFPVWPQIAGCRLLVSSHLLLPAYSDGSTHISHWPFVKHISLRQLISGLAHTFGKAHKWFPARWSVFLVLLFFTNLLLGEDMWLPNGTATSWWIPYLLCQIFGSRVLVLSSFFTCYFLREWNPFISFGLITQSWLHLMWDCRCWPWWGVSTVFLRTDPH